MRSRHVRHWIRLHDASEARLSAAIVQFFDIQLNHFISQLRDFHALSTAIVPQIFRINDEHERCQTVVRPHLLSLMLMGAANLIQQLPDEKSFEVKQLDDVLDEIPPEFRFSFVPEHIRQAIFQALQELEQQPYWQDIQRRTEERLADVIEQALRDGVNQGQMANRIREALGGDVPRWRALSIARTESTGALNSGHHEAMESVNEGGDLLIVAKQWEDLHDRDVRHSHRLMHKVRVGPKENFQVPIVSTGGGGRGRGKRKKRKPVVIGYEEAPYPGHYSLSAANRVRCRCTFIGVSAMAIE